jgi:enterochelin esterase-like enzyme
MTPRIYIDIGDDDRPEITKGATWLEGLLVKFDVPHEWHMFVGEHEEAYWQAHVEDYLRWYTLDWEK